MTQTEQAESGIEQILAKELSVTREQVWSAIRLLDSGATVPFIARYRKEATGGMTDTHLRMLSERVEFYRDLEQRRIEIIQSLEDQGKLTPSLNAAIQKASTQRELEDLYLPFKPKKNSRAQAARDKGLGPLAERLLADQSLDPEVVAKEYVDPDKAVMDAKSALSGARDILEERFSEDASLNGRLRAKYWNEAWIVSKRRDDKESNPEAEKFSDYFNHREPVKEIRSHRLLALLRGRKENVLDLSFTTDGYSDYRDEKIDTDNDYIQIILRHFNLSLNRRAADTWLFETARQTWKYRLKLRFEIDILSELREKADEEAIRVFAENLRNLLLASPAGPRVTMGLDPGYRTGVKVAVVNEAGKVTATGTIFPHPPEGDRERSMRALESTIKKYGVELIAIGNGTASRETDKLVIDVLKQNPDLKVIKVVVSEAGASVYSASELASKEHPTLDVTLRGAVSIARRLQDPLAELVKIEPKSIGVGQYQHDVNQRRLEKMLHAVVEDCVNAVGVDVNTASASLLSYVSGLSRSAAENLIAHREKNGLFKNRMEFLTAPEFGPRTFEQAAGFLRIRNSENPLDCSAVHPESYAVVEHILEKTQKKINELMGNENLLSSLKPEEFVSETVGLPTVQDILQELEKPSRDPRPEFKTATFKDDVNNLADLKPGMMLEGTITNVANFGAFVDIGVHQDGLVHISELADEFIKDPHTVVRTGQVVRVKVLEIDTARNRISLSMRKSSGPVKKNTARRY